MTTLGAMRVLNFSNPCIHPHRGRVCATLLPKQGCIRLTVLGLSQGLEGGHAIYGAPSIQEHLVHKKPPTT